MIFVATEFCDDRTFGVDFAASDWTEAEDICERNGWRLDGELIAVLDDADDAGQFVDQMNRGGLN